MKHLSSNMGIWFEQELQDVLRAILQTSTGITDHVLNEKATIYQAGFTAAVQAIAVALGVSLDQEFKS